MEQSVFQMRVADSVIQVRHRFSYLPWLCRDYIVEDAAAQMQIVITPEDIQYERQRQEESFSAPYLESVAAHRKLILGLQERSILLFHGSCVAVDGAAYLFAAPSGTGKSTHARFWRELLGDRAVMVNDDKPFLRVTPEGVLAYGSPWSGKHALGNNICVPLKAICILTRGQENRIEKSDLFQLYPCLLEQLYRSEDPRILEKTLELMEQAAGQIELYRLSCLPELEAAQIAYRAMRKDDGL